METTYADSWSDMAQSCDIWFVGHEVNVSMTFISWSSGFTLYLEDYLMYVHHTLGLWISMTHVWPKNKCRSLWPIFHGPVILHYILKKIIWCTNIILRDYGSVWPDIWPQNKCRSLWPIFRGPVILPYILTIWCMTSYFGIMSQYVPRFNLKIV